MHIAQEDIGLRRLQHEAALLGGDKAILQGVSDLNDYLTKDQQMWTSAVFTFERDGKYDVKYDYSPIKPKPAAKKPAAKPTAKKKAEAPK